LFKVLVIPDGYDDIIAYLSTGQPPLGLDKQELWKLAKKNAPYELIDGVLYILGPNHML